MGNLVSAHFTHGIGSGTFNIWETSAIVCFFVSTAHDLKLWDLVFNFSYNFYLCWYWVYERLNTASHLSSQICKICNNHSSLVLKLILSFLQTSIFSLLMLTISKLSYTSPSCEASLGQVVALVEPLVVVALDHWVVHLLKMTSRTIYTIQLQCLKDPNRLTLFEQHP